MSQPTANYAAQISARIDRLPSTATLWSWVVRISLGGFFEVYDLALTSLLSPLLVKAGIFQKDGAGFLGFHDLATFSFVTMAGIYIGALGIAGVADRWPRRSVFAASMLGYTVTTVLMSMQHSAAGIFLWRFAAGVALGIELVVIDCYLGEIAPKALRGRIFSISKFMQMCAVPVAGALAFTVGATTVLGIDGWRVVTFLPVVGAALVLVLRRRLPESARWLAAHGRFREADTIVRALEEQAWASGHVSNAPAVAAPLAGAPRTRSGRWRDLFHAPLSARVLMLILVSSTSSIVFYGFAHWAPTFLQHEGASVGKSLLYTALIGVAYPIAPLLGALVSDRIERRTQIGACGILIAVLGLVFAHQNVPVMWTVSGVLLVIFSEVKSTAIHTYSAELFPTELRAKAVGFVYSFSRLSTAFSGYLIAAVLARGGVPGVFSCLALLMGFSVAIVLAFGPRTLGRSFDEINPTSRQQVQLRKQGVDVK